MISWHIEPTSKCTLECPLCDRTWFYETFKKRLIHEINVDNLVNFLGQNADISFCGNNGDPIYHTKFIELCSKLKSNNCKISITTNGSYRTNDWWNKFAQVLDNNDKMTFSIDGLEDTNHLYRKNSDWGMLMNAVHIMANSNTPIVWKFIVFKSNQHQIDEARQASKDLGFVDFMLEYSDRWLDKKDLMPDKKYVNQHLTHQEKVLSNNDYTFSMRPKCLKDNLPNNHLYIDAEGNFYPCCWFGTYRYKFKSLFSPKNGGFNIAKYSSADILNNEKVKDFFNTTKDFNSAHECCKIQCGGKHSKKVWEYGVNNG